MKVTGKTKIYHYTNVNGGIYSNVIDDNHKESYCIKGLSNYFIFPLSTPEIWIKVSTHELPNSYLFKLCSYYCILIRTESHAVWDSVPANAWNQICHDFTDQQWLYGGLYYV